MRLALEARPGALDIPIARSSRATAGAVLAAACVVTPCVFSTRWEAVFVAPKLAALWGSLALVLAATAVAMLLSDAQTREARRLAAVDVALASFVLLNLAAWALSSDRTQSLYGERLQYQGLLTTLLYVAWFVVARAARLDERGMRRLVAAVVVGASLVSGYALAQRAGLDPVWKGFLPGGRVFSSIGQPNALAAYLVLTIPLSATACFARRATVRAAALAAVAAMTVALLLTFSRGGYLGLLAAAAVLAVGWRRELSPRARRWTVCGAVALVAGLGLLALAQPPGLLSRVASASDESVQIHLGAWRVAAQISAEHPLLGTGQETFPDVFPRYNHAVLSEERAGALDAYRVESPHNVYLGIAAGSGLPALAAYFGVLIAFGLTTIRAARRATREVRILLVGVLAALTGHLVTDAFMTPEITGTWLAWSLMGATLGFVATLRR